MSKQYAYIHTTGEKHAMFQKLFRVALTRPLQCMHILRAVLCNHLNFYIGSWVANSPILLKLSYLGNGDPKPSNQHSFHPYPCPLPWKMAYDYFG